MDKEITTSGYNPEEWSEKIKWKDTRSRRQQEKDDKITEIDYTKIMSQPNVAEPDTNPEAILDYYKTSNARMAVQIAGTTPKT